MPDRKRPRTDGKRGKSRRDSSRPARTLGALPPLNEIIHADAVRDASPQLTLTELRLLVIAPYEEPHFVSAVYPGERRAARKLVKRRLLEEDPTRRCRYRCTEAGTEVVKLWKRAGFTP